jgi:glycosyltransferase involved in cell wall biosynthesis
VVNVGRKDPSKDYKTFFKAIESVCQKFRKVNFLQIGADLGPCVCSDCGEGCTFESIGKINHQELANYYHAADMYVSSSAHESFGKVVVEAMSCGLPVVATATTGSKEIIKDGETGFLVPVGDSEMLARKILYLLNNPETAKQMGQKARQMAYERFDNEKITKEIVGFWKELIKH